MTLGRSTLREAAVLAALAAFAAAALLLLTAPTGAA